MRIYCILMVRGLFSDQSQLRKFKLFAWLFMIEYMFLNRFCILIVDNISEIISGPISKLTVDIGRLEDSLETINR